MIFDISAISKLDGESINVEATECLEQINGLLPDYAFESPITFKGCITNVGGHMVVRGDISAEYKTRCVRCLDELSESMNIHISETVRPESYDAAEAYDSEDYTFKGDTIDVDKIVIDAIIVNLPSLALCNESCKGLCPTCGINLNVGECNCTEEYTNPAMEKLKNFFEK